MAILIALSFIFIAAASAGAYRMEEEPDFWGALGTGPVWFGPDFGWGVYVQAGYYFAPWVGLGLATDWSMDGKMHLDNYTRTEDDLHGGVTKDWEYSRRRQWYPTMDLRFRWPMTELIATCLDLGLGAMIDDTNRLEKHRFTRNDRTTQSEKDVSVAAGDGAFVFRPALVFKVYNFSAGYRFFLVADGSDWGHMAFLGIDWDI